VKRSWIVTMSGILALCLSTADAKTPRNNATTVLETFAAGDFQYQIAVEPCVKKEKIELKQRTKWEECPITVNLLKNGKRLDEKTLPLAAEDQKFERDSTDPSLLNSAGSCSNCYVGVSARLVQLDTAYAGLLVTQSSGFEWVTRDHVLYIIDEDKLKRVWSFSDSWYGGHPEMSFISPLAAGTQHFLLFEETWVNFFGEEEEPDWVRSSLLEWRADRKEIVRTPLPTKEFPLYAVVAGFYPKVSSAREAAKGIECAEGGAIVRVLATDNYLTRGQTAQKAMLGNVFFKREKAQEFQVGLKRCMPAMESEMIPLN